MTEAQVTIELHRRTGAPVLECREAVRAAPDDREAQAEFLRQRYAERFPVGVMFRMPPGLAPD